MGLSQRKNLNKRKNNYLTSNKRLNYTTVRFLHKRDGIKYKI